MTEPQLPPEASPPQSSAKSTVLTSEEITRIEEEERIRAEARAKYAQPQAAQPPAVVILKKEKNPTTAGVLVFLFNGLGWLYLGAWGKLLLYYIVVGFFVLPVSGLTSDWQDGGLMVFVPWVLWHFGNVYLAVREAKKWNKQIRDGLLPAPATPTEPTEEKKSFRFYVK